MAIVFSGDTVFPPHCGDRALAQLDEGFLALPKVVNLEGPVSKGLGAKRTAGVGLSSDIAVLDFLKRLNVKAVCTANNHYFDYEIDVLEQKRLIESADIESFGSGMNVDDAAKAYIDNEEKLVCLNFGWKTIGCHYAGADSPGVNPYNYPWIIRVVKRAIEEYPNYSIVCVFHWNYEFEQYPQPADRAFSHRLIDEGVAAIFGHHAHIIQGYELYKGSPIFYGLGNFFFPNGDHGGVDIQFPSFAQRGLSVEFSKNDITVHITEVVEDQYLKLVYSGAPENCELLTDFSSFAGLGHEAYLEFFKEHRVKKKFLPIYRSYENKFEIKRNDWFVGLRQIPLDLLCRIRGRRD